MEPGSLPFDPEPWAYIIIWATVPLFMKGLFHKVVSKTSSTLSKSDKKKYNQLFGGIFDMKEDYKIIQITGKLRVVRSVEKPMLFEYYDKIYPTVANFDKTLFKAVVLDEGALGPLSRGADVMAPGVIKYKHLSSQFSAGDVVGVEILNQGIYGVGKCLVGFDEMLASGEGPVIELYHTKDDCVGRNEI